MLRSFIKKIRTIWHLDIADSYSCIKKLIDRVDHQTQNELSLLCDLYGSDKGSIYGGGAYYNWRAHTYTPIYEYFFSPIRLAVKQVFECGLGTNNPTLPSSMGIMGQPGASLRVWRDYFPNAIIIGADIDEEVLFFEDRIHTGYINQLSSNEIKHFFENLDGEYSNIFDIMIDDGLHTVEAAKCLFENAFNYLREKGLYIIEDIHIKDIPKLKEYFKTCKFREEMYVRYMLMPMEGFEANNLILIKKVRQGTPPPYDVTLMCQYHFLTVWRKW